VHLIGEQINYHHYCEHITEQQMLNLLNFRSILIGTVPLAWGSNSGPQNAARGQACAIAGEMNGTACFPYWGVGEEFSC
jgi:hypothetical protein